MEIGDFLMEKTYSTENNTQFVAFDGRQHFYQEIYDLIKGFNQAYRENEWYDAIGYLESWHGLLEPFIRSDKRFVKIAAHWTRWHAHLVEVITKIKDNWTWDDYNERWIAHSWSGDIDVTNMKPRPTSWLAASDYCDTIRLTREGAIQEIRRSLSQLRNALTIVMHEKKMLLPEREEKKFGDELKGSRYG